MTGMARVGIDVASVEAVAESMARFGAHYVRRVYTAREIASCGGATPRPNRLAECFATKEAVIKALGTRDEPVDLRDIEIGRDPGGRCTVRLAAGMARIAEREGLLELHASAGRRGDVAVSWVLAMFAPNDRARA